MRTRCFLGSLLVGLLAAIGCSDDSTAPPLDGGGGSVGHGGSSIGHQAGSSDGAGETQAGEATGGSSSAEGGNTAQTGGSDGQGGAPASVCNDGKGATISGRVTAPNGELPLAGVTVYVATSSVDPLPYGPSCWLCENALRGDPVAVTSTDAQGHFELGNVTPGQHVQLVAQTGKWQRKLELEVLDCQDNPVTDDEIRLPRSQAEGNLPRIALVSGAEDTLECLLLKLGVADSEFEFEQSGKRVQLFTGKGGLTELDGVALSTLAPATALWSDPEVLGLFDLVLLGSESDQNAAAKPAGALTALHDYAKHGGRVLLQHHQSYFLEAGASDVSDLASFGGDVALTDPFTAKVDTGSARGKALSAWLAAEVAGSTAGELELQSGVQHARSVKAPAQRLLYGAEPASVQAFSVDLANGDGDKCGRITATDILTAAGDSVAAFPAGCSSTELNPQELALGFLIFDLGDCL